MSDQVLFDADALSYRGTHDVRGSVNHNINQNVRSSTAKKLCIQSNAHESDTIAPDQYEHGQEHSQC